MFGKPPSNSQQRSTPTSTDEQKRTSMPSDENSRPNRPARAKTLKIAEPDPGQEYRPGDLVLVQLDKRTRVPMEYTKACNRGLGSKVVELVQGVR